MKIKHLKIKMTPQLYQPEGDSFAHVITAEVVEDLGGGLLFLVMSDGKQIGEIDVDRAGDHSAFISGVGTGEHINNGYLRPASFVIASYMRDLDPEFKTLYDINNEPLKPAS